MLSLFTSGAVVSTCKQERKSALAIACRAEGSKVNLDLVKWLVLDKKMDVSEEVDEVLVMFSPRLVDGDGIVSICALV